MALMNRPGRTRNPDAFKCIVCDCLLDTEDPLSRSVDAECLRCSGEVNSESELTVAERFFRLGFRAGVMAEGGGDYEHQSESMHAEEQLAWEIVKDQV